MQQFLSDIVILKIWMVETTGLDRDALHIYVALLIQLIVALPLRRRIASFFPLFVVICAILLNEWSDLRILPQDRPYPQASLDAAAVDLANTLTLPVLLFLLARFWPGLIIGRSNKDAAIEIKEE